MPTSCSAFSSGCTEPKSSRARAWAWRSRSASWHATAGGSGLKRSPARARAFRSLCPRRPEHGARADRDSAGGRQRRGRGDDDARPAAQQPRQPSSLGEGRCRGARLPLLHRAIRWPQSGAASQARAARYQDAQGRRHRGAAPPEAARGDARHSRCGNDLLERGTRRPRQLSARRQQLHRQAGSVRCVYGDGGEDRPVLGADQPGTAVIGIPTPTIRVLLTEDVPADAELEVRELKRAGLRIAHRIVDSEQAFVQAAREFAPDIILSDFSMPSFDGMAALSLARQLCPEVPFIFVSGTIGEEYAIRALKNGATDYVLKTNLVRLPAAVERALAEAKERRERRKVEIELELVRGRLASIIDSLPDVLWSVQLPSEDILYIGPTSREIFGREAQDFLTDRDLWINVVHPDDRPAMLAAWRAMRAEGRPFDVEYRVLRPDGGERWVNDRGHIVRDSAGVPYRIDGVTRDITEQIGHRRRIERLSRIRDFTSSINSTLVRERERGALFDEICRIAVEA